MKKLAALLAGAMMMMATSAMALQMPGGDWTNLQSFLDQSYFPNAETSITAVDFANFTECRYTAIGFESGNYNIVERASSPDPLFNVNLAGSTTFSTADLSNWGTWSTVDFSKTNLYFEDGDPANVPLNPFTGTSDPGFKIYQLTANDSLMLSYLANPIYLAQGTYIVGFNDNNRVDTDTDYDDIIIAIAPVPEPGTIMLLGAGLLGLGLYGRRRMQK